LQEKLVLLRKAGRIGDVLLLLEHTPVITLGRNAKSSNVLASPEVLVRRGVEVFECDRGGDVTFHGPGQLVAYPIFDLRGFPSAGPHRRTLGAVEYMRQLEEVLIRTCADFGIPAKRIPGLTGVWTERRPGTAESNPPVKDHDAKSRPSAPPAASPHPPLVESEAKIAALGVHISGGVTSHGMALNVNTDLRFFSLIVPCGIATKPVTSMQREGNRALAIADVAYPLSRNFGLVFERQMLWLDSLEALLGNNIGVPMRVPEPIRKLRREDDSAWA
jgi:lipoyl(octanoyl) transferase